MIATDLALFGVIGTALGTLYFILLFASVRKRISRSALTSIAGLYMLRYMIAVAGFWLIAQQGARPLIAALLGFLVARLFVQHRIVME